MKNYIIRRDRRPIVPLKHFVQLPERLKGLYAEVVTSHNGELLLLCAIGLRTLLEGVCADKSIDGGDLKMKIDRMKSLLPDPIVENLHEFRFMGNSAAHELAIPSATELSVALDAMEDILNFLYELDYKTSLLRKLRGC